jgi:hypothetical protein
MKPGIPVVAAVGVLAAAGLLWAQTPQAPAQAPGSQTMMMGAMGGGRGGPRDGLAAQGSGRPHAVDDVDDDAAHVPLRAGAGVAALGAAAPEGGEGS